MYTETPRWVRLLAAIAVRLSAQNSILTSLNSQLQVIATNSKRSEQLERPEFIKRMVELGSLLIAVGVGFSFASGLVIMNIHLARFGVLQFSLGQAQYVLIGCVAIFLMAFSVMTVWCVAVCLKDINWTSLRWFQSLRRVGYIFFAAVFVLEAVFSRVLLIGSGWLDSAFYRPALSLTLMGLSIFCANAVFRPLFTILVTWINRPSILVSLLNNQASSTGAKPVVPEFYAAIGMFISVPLALIYSYAVNVYPYVRSSLAGGEPQEAVIYLDKQHALLAEVAGVKPLSGEVTQIPVVILAEGSDYYLMKPKSPDTRRETKSFRLRKDTVLAITYFGKQSHYSK